MDDGIGVVEELFIPTSNPKEKIMESVMSTFERKGATPHNLNVLDGH